MTRSLGRVLVVNHWHDDNRGDSAITQGILRLLYGIDADVDVTVVGLTEPGELWEHSADSVRRSFPRVTVIPSLLPTELRGRGGHRSRARVSVDAVVWVLRLVPHIVGALLQRPTRRVREAIGEADTVVVVGGSNIYDDPSVSRSMSLARLFAIAAPAHAAVVAGKRVVLMGHTLGPFGRAAGSRLARLLLTGVDCAVVREATSMPVAQQLGVREVVVAPDMAFAVEPEFTPRVAALLADLPVDARRCMGISIRQHPSLGADVDRRLIREVAAAARILHDSGVIDAVVAVAHTVGPTPIEDDRPITQELMRALFGSVPATLIDTDLTPGELSAFYGALSVVTAVRLHAAILALAVGAPVYAISYFTRKTHGVMAGVGLGDAVADFETVTSDQVVSGIHRLLQPAVRERLGAESSGRRADLEAQAAAWLSPRSTEAAEVSS